jgi:uncharacterized membrane protein
MSSTSVYEAPKQTPKLSILTENLIIGALLLVAGLAWNEAITTAIRTWLPNTRSDAWGLFLYAIIITVVVVVLVYSIIKLSSVGRSLSAKILPHSKVASPPPPPPAGTTPTEKPVVTQPTR